MTLSSRILLATTLFLATPAFAGSLTFANGQTTWHSTQCAKPNASGSVLSANPETDGDDMNSMIGQHNAYVDAMQNYMNCVSNEAQHDESLANQAITNDAQKTIADAQAEVDSSSAALRSKQE